MADQTEGPDTTSIRPISSLRSKFEQLGKAQEAGQSSPVTPRQPSLNGTGTPFNVGADRIKPLTATVGSNGGVAGSAGGAGAGAGRAGTGTSQRAASGQAAATPRERRSDSPASRPTSMVAMSSSPRSPPSLVVNSPRSPNKSFSVDLRPTVTGNPLQPLTPNRTGMGDSPTRGHARTISRTTTPALEARMSALFQSTEAPTFNAHAPAEVSAPVPVRKAENATGPPLVNRAAKPKVPVKPPILLKKSSTLAAPDVGAELTDRSASPFSTPPSSEETSPDRKQDYISQGPRQRARNQSSASAVQRVRNDSDASWVQRIRGDSDASFADRARSGSNASFVEASSLPDSWSPPPPPTLHAAPRGREQQSQGLSQAPPTPARLRPSQSRHSPDVEEDRPRLPARPELQIRSGRTSPPKSRSGRTSPTKIHKLPPMRSVDGLRRAHTVAQNSHPRIPAVNATSNGVPRSALHLGFDRSTPISSAPAIPAPRRSADRRREMPPPPPPPTSAGHSRDDEEDAIPAELNSELVEGPSDYPDATQANRRAPKFKQRPWQIPTEYDTRLFAVCGEYVCTTGYITRVWNVRTGESLMSMEHRETPNTKVTAVAFKPSPNIDDEGKRLWLGTNAGEIHEVDIPSGSIVKTKSNAHSRREVIRMFRYASELWTLDDGGELYVWKPDHKGMPSLDSQINNWRVPKGHTFSIASGKHLWIATGKEIRVFRPGAQTDSDFHVLKAPLSQPGTGDVTSGACLDGKQDLIYFGHSDGKVTIYSRKDFSCRAVVNVSVYRISCLAGVGDYLWAGYSTGMAYIYDTSTTPWSVKKDWQAHDKMICGIIADPSAMWKIGRLNVVTLGMDNLLRVWDGMLKSDWIESRMQGREPEFCTFRELTAAVLTWNAGAVKPSHLQYSQEDNNFFKDYLRTRESPDILVFGFQELVDLEDKKVTAKSFFKSKKKDPAEKEHMSHQYRAWRDHLTKCIEEYMPGNQSYAQVHTASMVGLFTCIFVKSAERARIKYVHASEVKRGMGGLHGNKGAIIVRLVLDDSSICFVNCHLAAGQTQTLHRNNDVAAILEANALPPYPLNNGEGAQHSDVFASGGDGSMIMDHEICVLNGDLNYRIDTMGRDTVVKHVQQGNLGRLLERDQLLLSRRKNPGFRLRAFQESTITFAPTYKYNLHTDDYDTSEKRRAPAWCDRILYRGLGKVKLEDYRRWDQIRVSDHRPVSGRLRMRVKRVDPDQRDIVWEKCGAEFEGVSQRIERAAQLEYLTNVLGLTQKEAATALQVKR